MNRLRQIMTAIYESKKCAHDLDMKYLLECIDDLETTLILYAAFIDDETHEIYKEYDPETGKEYPLGTMAQKALDKLWG